MIRSELYDEYNFDEYPLGTNAIVAVISYTVRICSETRWCHGLPSHSCTLGNRKITQGYDMEDAMIVNKSARERGFANAHVIATKVLRGVLCLPCSVCSLF